MKYWLWLLAKIVLVVAGIVLFWRLVSGFLPPAPSGLLANWPRFGSDLDYTFAVCFAGLFGFGLGWLCAVDQVYRCRRCARRLRMPVSEGNYSRTMLEGSPYTEYICTYGHGKLYVPDVHLSSSRAMGWIGYGSLWENLLAAEEEGGRK